MDFENTSAEMQEVAEPAETEEVTETGVEEPEVAEPESETAEDGKTEADARFAQMRRQMEEAQREAEEARAELEEFHAQSDARNSAISRLMGDDGDEIAAIAEVTGMSEDEIRAEMEAAEESAQKDLRIKQLEEQVNNAEAERLMQADLDALRKIDPTLGSLEELGDGYVEYIAAGLSPEKAYWAIKAEEGANRKAPPKEVGKVVTGSAEKDYFTEAEIDAMSSEQLKTNWKKVFSSWGR